MAYRTFSEDLKEAVLLKIKSGRTVASVSEEYGISEQTIYKWKRQLKPKEEHTKAELEAKVAHLTRENQLLKEDLAFMEKATAWFAKKTRSSTRGRTA